MFKNILNRLEALELEGSVFYEKSIAIMHPHWRGIRSSTENLFNFTQYLGDTESDEEVRTFAEVIADTGIKTVVLSGFPTTYTQLVGYLNKFDRSIKILCLWHGSFLQSNEEYNWNSFKEVFRLCQEKKIVKWGFVKKGNG